MKILSMKSLGIICLLLTTSLAFANNNTSDTADSNLQKDTTKAVYNNTIDTQTCPENFFSVKLPNNGKLCQVFATDLPASMIFFVPQAPNEVVAFYNQAPSEFSTTKQVKARYMLQSSDKNTTLIISNDGTGTQVDVLVIGDDKI